MEQIQAAWLVSQTIMNDSDAPAGVRLEAASRRLDRLIGKAADRIEVIEEIPQHQQMMAQVRRTPEGRAAIRELIRHMREAARPAIDVTPKAVSDAVG